MPVGWALSRPGAHADAVTEGDVAAQEATHPHQPEAEPGEASSERSPVRPTDAPRAEIQTKSDVVQRRMKSALPSGLVSSIEVLH
jgi:hypothetical protein